jgi:hypothetical protein
MSVSASGKAWGGRRLFEVYMIVMYVCEHINEPTSLAFAHTGICTHLLQAHTGICTH